MLELDGCPAAARKGWALMSYTHTKHCVEAEAVTCSTQPELVRHSCCNVAAGNTSETSFLLWEGVHTYATALFHFMFYIQTLDRDGTWSDVSP